MSQPRYNCCAFPMWEELDDTTWTCLSCGCVWDEYGGVIEDGIDGLYEED